MSDTTEPAPGAPAASPVPDLPAVLLAFAPRSPRPPARRIVPPDGLILGRDLSVFDGGPLDDARMSRRHAEVRPSPGGGLRLRDLDSKNGTWVRGARFRDGVLGPGEAFRLGDSLFLVTAAAPAGSDPDLVGESPAIAAVVRSVRLVAPHAYAVLLQGETGTGKEVAARAIHRESGRRGSFVVVNCAALSEGVLESELFGHARGAFTGAQESRDGLFRAAAAGTLMLDEIGELPLSFQAKLLRAADSGKVRPVGAVAEIDADVRLVAATNADLSARVQNGTFRADLYARLAQWTLVLPPLRERREDVPFLARHLLATLGQGSRAVEPDLAQALLDHPWPLNVRGLRSVLAAAVVACPDSRPLRLAPEVRSALAGQTALVPPSPDSHAPLSPAGALPPSRPAPPDAAALQSALAEAGGNIAGAARALGGTRQQLYRWARALGVPIEPRRGKRP